MISASNVDRKVLEAVHDLLRDLILQIEDKLFYPKDLPENVIDMKFRQGEDPF